MLNHMLFFITGLIFLTWGAEWLVRGASKVAQAAGVSSLVIGLTIVAYGTSSPELLVNIQSAIAGKSDIALGNVVGSNIFNILFILGACAVIAPLHVAGKLIKIDLPIMILVSGLLYVFCLDYYLSFGEGCFFVLSVASYTYFCFWHSKKENNKKKDSLTKEDLDIIAGLRKPKAIAVNSFLIISGLGLLVAGAHFLVESSVAMARHFGVSELVIALTIVAAGTSLPEVATSIMAAVKGERDIAIGNVVGSNIYNILSILGITSVITTRGININPVAMVVDVPFMVFVAFFCYLICRSKLTISRLEGLACLLMYIGYTVYLIQSSH